MTESSLDAATGTAPLTADVLEPRVGEEFVFARPANPDGSPAGVVRMRLLELKRLPPHDLTEREPFSMIFVVKDQASLGMGLHRLLHPELEPFDMFLSRVSVPRFQKADPAGMFYEAVFN
jgi:hypothetical protein